VVSMRITDVDGYHLILFALSCLLFNNLQFPKLAMLTQVLKLLKILLFWPEKSSSVCLPEKSLRIVQNTACLLHSTTHCVLL
jgi:hypothetical protein